MKKTLILGLIMCSSLFFVSCGADQSKTADNTTTTESTETVTSDDNQGTTSEQTQNNNKTDDKTTDKKDEVSNDNSKDNTTQKKDTNTTTNKTENSSNKDKSNTPSKDDTSSKDSENKSETDIDNSLSKYLGTWKISKVIGKTAISSNNKAPVGKTLVLGKDTYKNNATGLTIDNPSYLESNLKSTAFAKGFNMQNLNGTGLKGDTINVIDITSSTNPNSAVDEIIIQDGYIVYLQDGVLFKCTKL